MLSKSIEWVMNYVTIVSYSTLVNENSLKLFRAGRGLRQGNPISPYLFVMIMEYLTRCLVSLENLTTFGCHPKCKRKKTIALLLVDDLLIFISGILHIFLTLKITWTNFQPY